MVDIKILRNTSDKIWQSCYQHPFVQEIGRGTLSREKFEFFLIQDYKFLLEYIKILSLEISKTNHKDVLYDLIEIQKKTFEGIKVHEQYLNVFEISEDRVNKAKIGLYNDAYISSLRNVTESKGVIEFLAAILPCPWSYHDFACKLIEINKKSLHQNPYKTWIQNYANKKTYLYIQEKLEEYSNKQKCEEIETLQKIFIRSLEYEYLFWDMCYRQTYNF